MREKRCIECYSIHEFEPGSKEWERAVRAVWLDSGYTTHAGTAAMAAIGRVLRDSGFAPYKVANDGDGNRVIVYRDGEAEVAYTIFYDYPPIPPYFLDVHIAIANNIEKSRLHGLNRQVEKAAKLVWEELSDPFQAAGWAFRRDYLFTKQGRSCPIGRKRGYTIR